MQLPTIHLNGTSQEALVADTLGVCRKLREALDVMRQNGPNARDYYVQGPDAYPAARREHEARIDAVQAVCDEYHELALAISNGGAK